MKTKTIKRYSFAMASVMFLTNAMPLLTFAVPTKDSLGSLDMNDNGDTVGVDFTQGQTTHYHEEITNEVTENTTVYVSQASSFGVIIPKTIILDGKTKNATYEVSVTGNIGGQESIEVVPEDSFLMKQQGKNDIDAIVTQDKTSWIYNEFETKGNGTIVAEDMTAGSWNGQFNFNIFLNENSNEEENETPLSLSLVTNELAMGTGEQAQVNAYYDGEDVTSLVNWESDNENIIVENGLIETKANAQVGDTATITVSVDENQLNETLVSSLIDTLTLTNVTYAENNDISIDFIVTIVDIEYTIESVSLHPGESQDITAKIIPENVNGIVSWSSTAISGINLIRNGNTVTIKVADDMETGKTYYIIATYGNYSKTLPINIVSSHEHNYIANTQEATCTTSGKITYTCDCGSSYFETIAVLGHDFENEYTTDKEPTCTVEGSKSQHCSRCDATQNITSIDALGHSFNTKEVSENYLATASDCENAATYYFKCDRCDAKGSETYVNGSENGHQFSDWNTTLEPTCTTKGSEERSCTVCGKVETQDKDALGHDFASEYTTDKEPTCTQEGSKSQHCSRCSATQNVTSIEATGHTSVKGGTEQVHESCSVCGTILSSTHTYTNKVVIEPTCETKGTTQYTCDCGYSYTKQDIDALGHKEVNGGTSDAHTKCSICNTPVSSTHTYTSSVEIEPTCDVMGTTKYTCTCGYSYTKQDIETISHTFVNNKCSVCKSLAPGLYNSSNVMLVSWENSGIKNMEYSCSSTSTTSPYYVITNNYPNTTKVVLPNNISSIGNYAFEDCTNLKSVVIPSNVKKIGSSAFSGCTNLTSVTIKYGVTKIDSNAFQGCSSLTTIVIPDSVVNMSTGVFKNCTNLKYVTLSNNLYSLQENTFSYCTALTTIVIPGSVKYITNPFTMASNLNSVTIEDGVENIGSSAFYSNLKLTRLTIPDSVISIANDAFNRNTHITYNGTATGSPWGAGSVN